MKTFEEKATFVAKQYDEWGVSFALLGKNENIYDLIERLYNALAKHPVEGSETYNQWVARVAVEGYSNYCKKMGDRPILSIEERERRYQEHKKKFLGK